MEEKSANGLPVVLSVLVSLVAAVLGWRGDVGVAWAVGAFLLAGASPALALLPHGRWPSVVMMLGGVGALVVGLVLA